MVQPTEIGQVLQGRVLLQTTVYLTIQYCKYLFMINLKNVFNLSKLHASHSQKHTREKKEYQKQIIPLLYINV